MILTTAVLELILEQVTRIIGIDPGSRVTGFCVLRCNGKLPAHPKLLKIDDTGAIKPDLKLPHHDRIGLIHQSVGSIIQKWKPDFFVIEKAFIGVNSLSALRLGETRGSLIAAARNYQVNVHEVSPNEVKKAVTGRGHAAKEEVARCIGLHLNITTKNLPHDVTDAMAIAFSFAIQYAPQQKNITISKELAKKTKKKTWEQFIATRATRKPDQPIEC